jgi:hypothetical protein
MLLLYLCIIYLMVSTPYFGGRFVSVSDSESYTGNSIVIGTASVAGQVNGYILDNRRYAARTEAVRWQRQHWTYHVQRCHSARGHIT